MNPPWPAAMSLILRTCFRFRRHSGRELDLVAIGGPHGSDHFLTKTLPKVAAETALSVLAYNLTRVMNIVGTKPLMAAIVT
jgi:hypothetical protein